MGEVAMFDDNIYEEALGEDQTNLLNQSIHDDIEGDDENQNPADPSSTKVELKIRKARNTIRPIDRFMGDRGLQSIGDFYKDVRYKGKHREKDDINLIIGRMQHWAHRAFPKMKFDDALDIVEGLTKKKIIQTHMHKYRMDMLQPAVVQTENENQDMDDPLEGVQPMDEFDDLLSDQIEQMTRVQQRKAHSTTLNNNTTTTMMNHSDVSLGCAAIPSTPEPTRATLSAEQMAKIAENRLKALERQKQRKLEMEAAAANPSSPPSVPHPNESIDLDDD